MNEINKTVWPCVNYVDAPAAIRFLTEAFGFVSTLTVPDESDPSVIVHAELVWPEGGGIMLGTANRADSEFSQLATSCAGIYVVSDDPHAVYAKVTAAGAKVVREMKDEDYGSTGFTAADPEGNLWSFGTYRGTPPPS
jgi:uncharacterized glyoxalase superfamily protein PhnB